MLFQLDRTIGFHIAIFTLLGSLLCGACHRRFRL